MVNHELACFTAFGASFRLAGDLEMVASAVDQARALGWVESAGSVNAIGYVLRRITRHGQAPTFELECDNLPVGSAAKLDELLETFVDHARLQTACRARGVVFVHAGAIGWHGRGLVVPGRSGAGKTTLVRALIDAGADYYSDEFAVLDAAGHLHPFPVPLSIRGVGARPTRHPVEEIGGRVGAAPIAVGLVVATEYRRGARWQPRVLSRGEALLALMQHTVTARRPPQQTLPLLGRTVLRGRAISTPRGDARATAERILDELA